MKNILQAIKSMFRGVYNAIEASKTHWDTRAEETVEYTFDGNIEGKVYIPFDENYGIVKVADDYPIDAAILKYQCDWHEEWIDEDTGEKMSEDYPDDLWEMEEGDVFWEEAIDIPGLYYGWCGLMYADRDIEPIEDIGFPGITKGLYFGYESYEDGWCTYNTRLKFVLATGELKKLDAKYLPDNLATVQDVEAAKAVAESAQATANNAQTTADNVKATVKIPKSEKAAVDYSQCLTAYEKGFNLIYVNNGEEYEFDKYLNNKFYFRRYDPETLKFKQCTVSKSSTGSTEKGIIVDNLTDRYRAPSGKAVQDAIHAAKPPSMTPATADEDGASGLVPAPAAGQQDMVLHGDGTWRAVEGGGGSGGGGKDHGWKLLLDLTLTQAMYALVLTDDKDGNAISCGEIWGSLYVPENFEGSNYYVGAFYPEATAGQVSIAYSANQRHYTTIYVTPIGGIAAVSTSTNQYSVPVTGKTSFALTPGGAVNNGNAVFTHPDVLTGIRFTGDWQGTKSFPIGTKVIIYGR